MYGSPGFSSEKLSIYFTDQLSEGEMNLDDDEFVELHKVSIENVKSMLKTRNSRMLKQLSLYSTYY